MPVQLSGPTFSLVFLGVFELEISKYEHSLSFNIKIRDGQMNDVMGHSIGMMN